RGGSTRPPRLRPGSGLPGRQPTVSVPFTTSWILQWTAYFPGGSDEILGTSLYRPNGMTSESNFGVTSSGTFSVKEWPGPAVGSASTNRIDSPCLMVMSLDGM